MAATAQPGEATTERGPVLARGDWDAVLFDLDGVLTRTETLHRTAWKETLDGLLVDRARRRGEEFRGFDAEDYFRHVDGRSRLDGVHAFLESRGIRLRTGAAGDAPGTPSEHGIANEKNERFNALLREHGVVLFEGAVDVVRALRAAGFRTAVVSASRNCHAVLEAAGITALFDAVVDGVEQARLRLAGKPAPDAYLEAARRLGSRPARTVVVEDAIVGVAAARAGGFGLVVGIGRGGTTAAALAEAGAHVVLATLGLLRVAAGGEP